MTTPSEQVFGAKRAGFADHLALQATPRVSDLMSHRSSCTASFNGTDAGCLRNIPFGNINMFSFDCHLPVEKLLKTVRV